MRIQYPSESDISRRNKSYDEKIATVLVSRSGNRIKEGRKEGRISGGGSDLSIGDEIQFEFKSENENCSFAIRRFNLDLDTDFQVIVDLSHLIHCDRYIRCIFHDRN